MTYVGIFYIVVGKPSHKQELGLIILLKINKLLKIDFYDNISSFSLAVSLQIQTNE